MLMPGRKTRDNEEGEQDEAVQEGEEEEAASHYSDLQSTKS